MYVDIIETKPSFQTGSAKKGTICKYEHTVNYSSRHSGKCLFTDMSMQYNWNQENLKAVWNVMWGISLNRCFP